jgi:hypothetical protein
LKDRNLKLNAEEGRQVCRPSFVDSEQIAQANLDNLNVLSLPALGALGDVELNALAFLKRTETVRLDGSVMDEDVLAVFAAQKSKSLGVVKPLDCALFHGVLLLITELPSQRDVEVCE